MEDSQKEWIEGARRLDRNTLEMIYDTYSPALYRYAYRLIGKQDTAEECVSEAFTRFLEALHKGKGPELHLRAYLYRIVHNICTDTYRRQPPDAEPIEEEIEDRENISLQESTDHAIELDKIRSQLHRLTPDQRQVIVLRFFEGWENDEVASALGKPVGAVKALQHRALAALKRLMTKGEQDGSF